MKLSKILVAEHDFVEQRLRGLVICDRCQATLTTYANTCSADLSEVCPGFQAIEDARKLYNGSRLTPAPR